MAGNPITICPFPLHHPDGSCSRGKGAPGWQILIVDDNATNRRILTLQTQGWGMLPRATGSPQEALTWLHQGDTFGLAILDLHIPEMNGITLGGRLRSLPGAENFPLILLSSLGGNAGELRTYLSILVFLL